MEIKGIDFFYWISRQMKERKRAALVRVHWSLLADMAARLPSRSKILNTLRVRIVSNIFIPHEFFALLFFFIENLSLLLLDQNRKLHSTIISILLYNLRLWFEKDFNTLYNFLN